MIKKILDNIFSDTGEFVIRFIFAAVCMGFIITNFVSKGCEHLALKCSYRSLILQ